MKKCFVYILISLSVCLLILIMLLKQVPRTIEITIFPKAYNIVQNTEELDCLEIDIYMDLKNSYLVQTDNISNVRIYNEEDNLSFNLKEVIEFEDKSYFRNKTLYRYSFKLVPIINFTDEFKIEINNAVLELNYIQGTNMKIDIGSFCYYKYNYNESNLSLKKLKGLVNNYDDQMLVGVNIGLKNNLDSIITIKEIIPLDVNLKVSYGEIKDDLKFNQGQSINDLLGYTYNLFNVIDEEIDIEITEEIDLFLPLKYINKLEVNNLGFLIKYEVDNKIEYFCIDDFLFFETSLYSKKKINDLVFYTYENY